MKHMAIRVTGKVQGVFFRASTQQTAAACAIQGFVRNEPDGSVYIEAEGEEANLRRFMEWCKKGPSGARVDKLDTAEGTLRHYKDFIIDR